MEPCQVGETTAWGEMKAGGPVAPRQHNPPLWPEEPQWFGISGGQQGPEEIPWFTAPQWGQPLAGAAARPGLPQGSSRTAAISARAIRVKLREATVLFISTKYYPGKLPEVNDLFGSVFAGIVDSRKKRSALLGYFPGGIWGLAGNGECPAFDAIRGFKPSAITWEANFEPLPLKWTIS